MTISNEYSRAFGQLYERIPKAVFAAVAYSYCSTGGDLEPDEAVDRFLTEWATLYLNGLGVPRPRLSVGQRFKGGKGATA
jgi:hypothetical protein